MLELGLLELKLPACVNEWEAEVRKGQKDREDEDGRSCSLGSPRLEVHACATHRAVKRKRACACGTDCANTSSACG